MSRLSFLSWGFFARWRLELCPDCGQLGRGLLPESLSFFLFCLACVGGLIPCSHCIWAWGRNRAEHFYLKNKTKKNIIYLILFCGAAAAAAAAAPVTGIVWDEPSGERSINDADFMWKRIHGFDSSIHFRGPLNGLWNDEGRQGSAPGFKWKRFFLGSRVEKRLHVYMSERISIFSGALMLSYQTLTASTSHCSLFFFCYPCDALASQKSRLCCCLLSSFFSFLFFLPHNARKW